MKGKVVKCDHREYGFAQLRVAKVEASNTAVNTLFEGLGDEMQVRYQLSGVDFCCTCYQSLLGLDVSWRSADCIAKGIRSYWKD